MLLFAASVAALCLALWLFLTQPDVFNSFVGFHPRKF
jgi:hypothetical protein